MKIQAWFFICKLSKVLPKPIIQWAKNFDRGTKATLLQSVDDEFFGMTIVFL
ncbi:MAG: hypothetical protein MJB14_08925 [Spirochaetes bacterium]|nr:hypothetical protein [Spirochaetota bacterium]